MVFHLHLQQTKNVTTANKCTTSVTGHFDGRAGTLKQCKQHDPMQQIQGHTRCPWMPPTGKYLLSIAPEAARTTINKTTIQKYTYFSSRFDGHHNVAVQYPVHHPVEEIQGITRNHWMPLLGQYLLQ